MHYGSSCNGSDENWTLKDVIKLKVELLSKDDLALRSGMDSHANAVTKGKALSLWRCLLEQTGFQDMNVCDYMERGVPLTGGEPESNLYLGKFAPATMTVGQLDHQAVWRRRAMMNKQESDLMRESLEEVEAGFLEGPFNQRQLHGKLGTESWSLTRRFCLYQGEERGIWHELRCLSN
eukprot:s6236_g2.t1